MTYKEYESFFLIRHQKVAMSLCLFMNKLWSKHLALCIVFGYLKYFLLETIQNQF